MSSVVYFELCRALDEMYASLVVSSLSVDTLRCRCSESRDDVQRFQGGNDERESRMNCMTDKVRCMTD